MLWKEIKDKIESLRVEHGTKIWLIEITSVEFIQVNNNSNFPYLHLEDGVVSITN